MTNATMALKTAPTREELLSHFLTEAGWNDVSLHPLAGDASFRRYIRVKRGSNSAMLMDAPPDKEKVKPYLAIAKFLHKHGYSAPSILAENAEDGFLLLEDLGDDLFTLLLQSNKDPQYEQGLYKAAIELLTEWHKPERLHKNASQFLLPDYDYALLEQELGLFTQWYLPYVAGDKQAKALEVEYMAIWREIISEAPLSQEYFVHRDFHASNLMWLPEREGNARVGLLDFQDAVWGDAAYDLVSLLEDARRDVSPALAMSMVAYYLRLSGADKEQFLYRYAVLGAQRNCKIIGIFVRLWSRDKKKHYLPLLGRVWKYLEHDLEHPSLAPLQQWMNQHIPSEWRSNLDAHE